MRGRKPTASAAIVTGIGMIAFALFYASMGIFPTKTRWSPPRAVTLEVAPGKFRALVVFTVGLGAGILVWGITRSGKE